MMPMTTVSSSIPQACPGGRVQFGGQVMPAYNTLDPLATATFLYGLTSALLRKMIDLGYAAKTLMTSNLRLMTWLVSNSRADGRDLWVTSHPSVLHFYWMLSRTMFELEAARVQGMKTFQLVQDWYSAWNETVRFHVTQAILSVIQDGGLDTDGNPLVFVDGILPPDTVDKEDDKEEERPMGNDRLFSTACAANSLLAAWTVADPQGHFFFLPNTPADVALATKGLVNYVLSMYPSEGASFLNVLHSTEVKHCQTVPCRFPANSVVKRNGAPYNGSQPTPDILFGMRGNVPPETYDAMLADTRCGGEGNNPTSTGGDDGDLLPAQNTTSGPFFFWSAPVYTRALCLLAVGQLKNVKGQADSMEGLFAAFQDKT